MKLETLIKKAMIDKGIGGKMELIEKSGISYSDTTKVMNGDGSVRLGAAVELLGFLGYELKAVLKEVE